MEEGEGLLGEMQDIIRELRELEEHWQGPDLTPQRTTARTYRIRNRTTDFIRRWSLFESEIPEEINVELRRRLGELAERQRLLGQARWQSQMGPGGQRLLAQLQEIITQFGQLEERWQARAAEPPHTTTQTLLLHDRMVDFIREINHFRNIISENNKTWRTMATFSGSISNVPSVIQWQKSA